MGALTGAVTMITKSAAARHLLTRAAKRTEHVDALEKEWGTKGTRRIRFQLRRPCAAAGAALPFPKKLSDSSDSRPPTPVFVDAN